MAENFLINWFPPWYTFPSDKKPSFRPGGLAMYRNLPLLLILLILLSSFAFAEDTFSPWEFLGAQDNLLNGICSSGSYLFATTEEGLHYYNHTTEQWTDRTWPGWIGKSKYAAVVGQTHDQRLVTGGVNAWFKGTLFFSDDMGETESLVMESQGGKVTDMAASHFGDPAIFACTWSDVVDGELLRSDDDGESWTLLTGHGHHAMTDLAVLGSEEVFLAGDNCVTHTMNGGDSWENLQGNLPDGQGIYCLLAQPAITALPTPDKTETDAAVLMASNDSGLYNYNFDTRIWQQILPTSCRAIAHRFRQTDTFVFWTETYAVTWDSRVLVCKNMDWSNWQDITADLPPGAPLDVEANFRGVFVAMQGGGVFHSIGLMPLSDVPAHGPRLVLQAYPNPFNPATTIKFDAPGACHALLQIFDLRGALMATLVDKDVAAGPHSHIWRPVNLGSGVYPAVLQLGQQTVTGSVVLLK